MTKSDHRKPINFVGMYFIDEHGEDYRTGQIIAQISDGYYLAQFDCIQKNGPPARLEVPEPDGSYAYYVRYRKEGQHPLLCRQPRRSSVAATGLKVVEEMNEEQLLLDGMRSPKERRFSGSASQSIRPTTGCWCGWPTKLAPNFIRRVFASSKLAPTSPMWCPTPAAQQFGHKMPRPFTMCGSIKITGPPAFFAIG